MKKILLSFSLAIVGMTALNAQVKIGNNPNTINGNSLLELESTNKGFLPPRVSLNYVDSIAPLTATTPAGMLVYSTGGTLANGYYTWSGTKWVAFSMNDGVGERTNYVLVKSASDFPAPVSGIRTLVAGTFYEVNGTIILSDKINLNGCEIDGIDAINDKLIYTGSGELFIGLKGGTLEFLTMSAPSGKVFNINPQGAMESLLVENCFILGCNSVGTIKGFGGYVYFADVGFYANTNGVTFQANQYVYLNNSVWDISNTNTFEKFVGDCGVIQILGGSRTVATGKIGLDISGLSSLKNGSIKATVFLDSGTYVNGTFSNKWEVEAIGLNTEKDDVSSGNIYISATTATTFSAVNTPTKILGTTTSASLFRVTSPSSNRLTYSGTKSKRFEVISALSLIAAGNNKDFAFYIAKNGVILPESKQLMSCSSQVDRGSVTLSCTVLMATTDYLEVWMENNSDASSVTVNSLNLAIK